jgi:RES domain-containing protein
MIEYFVHADPYDPPKDLVVVMAEIPDGISRRVVSLNELPTYWRRTPAPLALAAIGDRFVREGRAAVLIVPSALAPAETNWLANPLHPDFARIRVRPPEAFRYDSRFFNW